jgi:hypothetical protein
MATTTNYGWTTPDDTALVKDGAAAIRTLGSSVDTTTKALNPSTTLGDIEYRSSTANTNTRLGIGTTGQILSVVGGVPAWASPAGGGKVLQVVSATTTTNANITSSSYVDTNIEATITPTSATSKIFVLISAQNLARWTSTGTVVQIKAQLLRGATQILENLIFAQLEGASAASGYKGSVSSVTYLDSPATTSATTYKLQAAKTLGSGIDFQGSNSNASTITLLEIGA